VDFLGNISLRLIGLLATVGTLAAIYFFVIKPTTDTANKGIDATNRVVDSISGPLKQAENAQQQLQHDVNTGGSQVDVNKLNQLQRCVQKAGQNANRLTRCTQRYAP
jgi:hypothetical protein